MRVVHVITGLGTGGAETMLCRLVGALPRAEFESTVVSLMDRGTLGHRISEQGVEVLELGLKPPLPSWRGLRDLRQILRRRRPALVQGWLYHGNLAATIASAGMAGPVPVAWNIRGTLKGARGQRALSRIVVWLGARLSGRPRAVVYNSTVAAREHQRIGYRGRQAHVIPNGFDTELFRPGVVDRTEARRRFDLPQGGDVVGMVARWHPQKDHATFLRAAADIAARRDRVSYALAGPGVDATNVDLARLIDASILRGRVHLLGDVTDVPALLSGLDVACLASAWGEGFPNAVGEAMASGVPCVVTDVGDSGFLLGDGGRVVRPGDSAALADALTAVLDLPADQRRRIGGKGRARVTERFSLSAVAATYAELYRTLVTTGR